ncbi:MAG: sugar ABC transporter ATP-binding protein [Planctomycetota bacterium]|jgi:ribose transport system ATP-binding protein|nr:sugar ABC transporter ATP-binding protein [Planctomycetota bacterium]
MEPTLKMEPILKVEDISKSFPGVVALDKVRMDLREGEVHALLGENGAGKSTLMKILSGVYQPDRGRITFKGNPITFSSALDSQKAGISIIYQELNLIPHLSVAQNIFLGKEPLKWGFHINDKKMNAAAEKILGGLNTHLDPRSLIKNLAVSKQQMVEVAKALSNNSEVLIMDEPTSALTGAEIEELFRVIRTLRSQKVGIIYISHRLEELKSIADRVTILRDGQYISTDNYADLNMGEIVKRMVGREMKNKFPEKKAKPSNKVILEVKDYQRRGETALASFSLRSGEILGVAGLMGAGRTELARAIFGADPVSGGELRVDGKPVVVKTPRDAIRNGIGYLSEDRKSFGLALGMQVKENITMAFLEEVSSRSGRIYKSREKEVAERFIQRLNIRTPSISKAVKNLSGGNQQKVVIAKWLFRNAKILFFDEPTRGIDVASKFSIYELMDQLAASGAGVIMISSDLPEILGMSDRIMVMCQGRIAAIFDRSEATQEKILQKAAGL